MRPILFLVTVGAIGCHQAPPAAVVSITPPAPRPSASSAPPPSSPCTARVWPAVDPPSDVDGPLADIAPDPSSLAGADPVLRSACESAERASKRHYVATLPSMPGPAGRGASGAAQTATGWGCFGGAKGAWQLELGAFHYSPQDGGTATWELSYLAADGKRITSKDARGVAMAGPGELASRASASVVLVFDFDSDGVGEVMLQRTSYSDINGFEYEFPTGYRVSGGAVVAWDPVPGRTVIGWADVDHDGRPDLVLDTGMDIFEVAHSLPGGAFSTDDEIARASLHAVCTRPPPPPRTHPGLGRPTKPGGAPARQLSLEERDKAAAALCAPVTSRQAECTR